VFEDDLKFFLLSCKTFFTSDMYLKRVKRLNYTCTTIRVKFDYQQIKLNKKHFMDMCAYRFYSFVRNVSSSEANSVPHYVNTALRNRVARFYFVLHTKTGKNIPNNHIIYQICRKIYQMAD
jgi:hypothetical protein